MPFIRQCGKVCGATHSADNIIRRVFIACWTNKATHTHTHTEYVLVIASVRQQLFRERTSVLSCTYIVCLVFRQSCRL